MSDSDDEYGPLQATWGSQTPATSTEETPGWDALKDPNAKLTDKGLGTGQLHRKGRNFKPIDEDIIIAQRLNKNSSTKKKSKNTRSQSQDNASVISKKDKQRKASLPLTLSPPQQHRGWKNPSSSTPTSPPMRPASSFSQNRRISRPATGAWAKPLVDTPFWESDARNIPSHQTTTTTTTTSSQSSSNNNNTYNNDTQQHSTNNGWGAPLPRNNNNRNDKNTRVNDQVGVTEADDWNMPQISTDGGWGNLEASSKDGWFTEDAANKSTESSNANGWNNNNNIGSNNQKVEQDNWGITSKTTRNNGYRSQANDNKEANVTDSDGWGTTMNNNGRGGASPSNNGNNDGWGSLNKATPSWLDSVPENPSDSFTPSPPSQRSREVSNGGRSRFSNKSRRKYSDLPIEVPKPRNYDTDKPVSFPTAVAPPPPPENDLLITINVELSDTIKVAVAIRELDEPVELAEKFAKEQNLQSPQVLQALVKLFTSQKEAALSKKRQRPVKKYPSRPHPTNYYTDAFEYPEYLPTVYNNAPSLTTPFTRRAYY